MSKDEKVRDILHDFLIKAKIREDIAYSQSISQLNALDKQEINKLKKGENDWWQKRWFNNDVGKQLFEIRKKWLTAYQCAENYQRMYEELNALKPKIDEGKLLEIIDNYFSLIFKKGSGKDLAHAIAQKINE